MTKQITGKYQYRDGELRFVTFRDNQLYLGDGKSNNCKLTPFANNQFHFEQAPAYGLTFEFEINDTVTRLKFESRTSMAIHGVKLEITS